MVQASRLDPPDRHAVLAFTGDTLVHSPLVARALANADGDGYDFSPMFDRVRSMLSAADLSICHLESPIVAPGAALSTFPVYAVPPQIATALAGAGYDRCSTASNHSLDGGIAEIDSTVTALLGAGLSETGMARTPEESVPTMMVANGITIAHLSYTYGFNGAQLPRDQPWRSNLIDVPTILAAAQNAKERGADFVVVNLHWGAEGNQTVTPQQIEVANELTASPDIDMIVGEHVHVIQRIDQVNGKWVVYGMGNFLSNMHTGNFSPASQDGEIVTISITENAEGVVTVDRPKVIPTWVDRDHGWVIRPVLQDLDDPATPLPTRDEMLDSLRRTESVVGDFISAG